MANITNMRIGIGAELGGLRSGLAKAQKQITSFSQGAEKRLNSLNTDRLQRGLSGIDASAVPAANKLSSAMGTVQGSTRQTTSAVINFNRVIQDAPFGIIGVANNIDPLIQSFNSLRASTGSTGGAIKTLLKSAFTGPGALITVFSLASTAALVFGDRLFGAGKKSEEAKGMIEGLNNEIDVMVKAIDRLQDFEDPFGMKSLNNELLAIKSRERVLTTAKERIDELVGAARALRSEALTEEGEIVDEAAFAEAEKLSQQAQQIADKFGTTAQINKRLAELETRRKETQQEINTTQAALNSSLVQEAEIRAQLLEQTRQQAQITQDDIIPADIFIDPGTFRVGPPIPVDKIIPADLTNIDQIMKGVDLDLGNKLFPPGTIGALQNKLSRMKEQIKSAIPGSEDFISLQQGIQNTQTELNSLTGQAVQSSQAMMGFAQSIGQVFQQAVLHGNDLMDVLENIAKQLAAKAFVTALGALLTGGASLGTAGFLGTLFSFHEGGVVPGPLGKERLILAQGGETVMTPDQMRGMGSGKAVIHNNLYLDGEIVYRNQKNVQFDRRR